MSILCWSSLAFQVLCFIGSAVMHSRMPPAAPYWPRRSRMYYNVARCAFYFQAACICGWCIVMLHILHK